MSDGVDTEYCNLLSPHRFEKKNNSEIEIFLLGDELTVVKLGSNHLDLGLFSAKKLSLL